MGRFIGDSKHKLFTRPKQVTQTRHTRGGTGDMVSQVNLKVNSLCGAGMFVVFLLSGIASTAFPTNVYGQIDFDAPTTESGSSSTAQTEG